MILLMARPRPEYGTRLLAMAILLGLVTAACGSQPRSSASPTPAPSGTPQAGARWMAISAFPRSVPTSTPKDLVDAIDLVYNAGSRGYFESKSWKAIEPRTGGLSIADLKTSLNYLGNTRKFTVLMLGIQVINTTAKETPADLAGVAFDSPQMKTRFHALVDAIKPALNSRVKYLSIGNEVDAYLSLHPAEWDAYRAFFLDAQQYVHSVLPGIAVGVTATFDGARGPNASRVAAMAAAADVWILTYYPLGAGFKPRAASTATADIAQMISIVKGKPLVLQEVGYPSAAALGSSEAAQADFVANVMAAWKDQGARIPFLNFLGLHDTSPSQCDVYAAYYGQPGSAAFKAYLCSLGLRHADGTPKAAWQRLNDTAKSTGVTA